MDQENINEGAIVAETKQVTETAHIEKKTTVSSVLSSLCDLSITDRLAFYKSLEKIIQHDREKNGMAIDPGTGHIEDVIKSLQ